MIQRSLAAAPPAEPTLQFIRSVRERVSTVVVGQDASSLRQIAVRCLAASITTAMKST
jgi:hypothetical protein